MTDLLSMLAIERGEVIEERGHTTDQKPRRHPSGCPPNRTSSPTARSSCPVWSGTPRMVTHWEKTFPGVRCRHEPRTVERVFGVPDYWGKLAEIEHFLFLWGKHGG